MTLNGTTREQPRHATAILEEVRSRRQDLASVLSNPEYPGIRRIVEELYPDRAHFIYELLQNAEDVGSHTAHFELYPDRLEFFHDGGRAFEERDIYGITNIGHGSKEQDDDTIGRFGLGFKAVFAYAETPHIYSGDFAFRITNLVLPESVDPIAAPASRTTFIFPFNNPKKDPATARDEIARGLADLSDSTLLFLRNIRQIVWKDEGSVENTLDRIEHGPHHIEIRTRVDGEVTTQWHYLRFSAPAPDLPKHNVAIVFALDVLNEDIEINFSRPLAEQFRIIPEEGRVSVYFPAEKEKSNLRFHLHAPFVPELSRASVKETPANEPLFGALAELSASSLETVRDFGLLTREFLEVLPNILDPIPPSYQAIRTAIIAAMVQDPLTPTYAGGHLPARRLLQARATLKELLSPQDLGILLPNAAEPPEWAIAPSQRNSNQDRFLVSLGIRAWDVPEFAPVLTSGTHVSGDGRLVQWLGEQSEEWHQHLYALLNEDPNATSRWSGSRIVLLDTGEHEVPGRCFFPQETPGDVIGARVALGTYTSGKSTPQQQAARSFLERIGVREMGEAEEIVRILHDRYRVPADDLDLETHFADLRRFMAYVAENPQTDLGLRTHRILRTARGGWATPQDLYVDGPYRETYLSAFFASTLEPHKERLTPAYLDAGFAADAFVSFAERIGVQTRLVAKETRCDRNPDWAYLQSVPGERFRNPVNRDWTIEGLVERLQEPTLDLSRLIWRTLRHLPPEQLQARYQKNQGSGSHVAPSQLVHLLRRTAWVAQTGDTPFVIPADAVRSMLPLQGFAYEEGERWLQSVEFGIHETEAAQDRVQEREWAARLGFDDSEQLERARRFVAIPPEEQQRVLFEWERRQELELPEHVSPHPERRSERVRAGAVDAPDRTSVMANRSVAVGLAEVKEAAEQYLRNEYTNDDGVMICQLCRDELPFRRTDGAYYFEKVSFLPDLDQRHHQNYLALCPNHGAMFQYANAHSDELLDRFRDLEGTALKIPLAGSMRTVYFTEVHRDDLRAVLAANGHEDADDSF
jgi:hypothetical protein